MSGFFRIREAFSRGRRPLRILGASGQLGYGVPTPAFEEGLRRDPDMIGADMGSTDIGPHYLGSGTMAVSRAGAKRDLRKLLVAARSRDIPLLIGSAGSAGAAPHLAQTLALVREIGQEEGLHFRLASIAADISAQTVQDALAGNRIRAMESMAQLSAESVADSTHLVAQMGYERFAQALEAGADVVVAGRACDTGIFAAMPILLGFPKGLAIHLAKIAECASLCCVPGGRDTILAELDDEGFTLESMNPARAATPASVAAHSLYEQADPFTIFEPAGSVDLTSVSYEAVDTRRTRASGARFTPTSALSIKLEGARLVGHRAILLCANADQRFISARQTIIGGLEALVEQLVCEDTPKDYQLFFRVYGVDGVMPAQADAPRPGEVGIIGECIAPSAERAMDVLRTAKQYLLHYGYEGRLSTAGNLAFPFTPPEISLGPAYEFSVYHLMRVDNQEMFPLTLEEIGAELVPTG